MRNIFNSGGVDAAKITYFIFLVTLIITIDDEIYPGVITFEYYCTRREYKIDLSNKTYCVLKLFNYYACMQLNSFHGSSLIP